MLVSLTKVYLAGKVSSSPWRDTLDTEGYEITGPCINDSHTRATAGEDLRAVYDADAIFVWLDATEAYGTMLEIGLALALNKPLFLAIYRGLDDSDYWYSIALATTVIYAQTPQEAWDSFRGICCPAAATTTMKTSTVLA